jgi:hypothetical protein
VNRKTCLPFLIVLAVLMPLYLATLQTIPNGAEHYYMIDVGETQIVLNRWGTLHATGYPLYVMTGNILVAVMRLFGMLPAAAPGVVSLLWGVLALGLVYVLAVHLTGRPLLAAMMTILFGLTRTVWIHNVIAEIYSFGLVFLALLLLLALLTPQLRDRQKTDPRWIYALALIGGLGVFHHRALIMLAPALIYVVWPTLIAQPRKLPRIVAISLFLGLLGFLPYLYLLLRGRAGAAWVYGEPGTWDGFLDQFLGREASRFIGPPTSWEGLLANFNTINTVLVTDLTIPGILVGLLGLLLAVRNPAHRRAAITLILSGAVAYTFHIALYTDILSALILPITLSLAFGWLFLADWVWSRTVGTRYISSALIAEIIISVAFGIVLINQNQPFIRDLTTNRTGLETIALARRTPPGSALMLDWGPRHFAVGFARDVLGEIQQVTLLDHKAPFRIILEHSRLVTPDFTFYNRPISWWQDQLGVTIYLNAVAPHLVEIKSFRDMAASPLPDGITPVEERVECTDTGINLNVAWGGAEKPDHDLSVFVHLLDAQGVVIAQADQSAPVYGWRPLSTWEAGELVRDVYPLPLLDGATAIRYGLYRQTETGEFRNEYVYETSVECGE